VSLTIYPVKIECYCNDTKDHVWTVEALDEAAAIVNIRSPVNVASWGEIAASIRDALVLLNLDGA